MTFSLSRTIAASVALVVFTSCNQNLDLAAVQNMAATAAASKSAFDAISADYYDSCVRQLKFSINVKADVDLSKCATQQKASQAWQGANAMLLAYFSDLGALATDKQTDFGLANLATSVGAIQGVSFKSTQQTAIVNAGSGLLAALYSGKRRDDLAKIMTQAELPDPAHNCPSGCLAEAVKILTNIAETDYGGVQLAGEDVVIQTFYDAHVPKPQPPAPVNAHSSPAEIAAATTQASMNGVARLIAVNYDVDEANARATVTAKLVAVSQYVSSLNELASAHQKILDAVRTDSPDQVAGIVNAFIATYTADVSAIRKAFP